MIAGNGISLRSLNDGVRGRRTDARMSVEKLRLVGGAETYELGRDPENVPSRARRLHKESQILAAEEVHQLGLTLTSAQEQAEAIRDGGEIFPVGVREQARQLAGSLPLMIQTLQSLSERHLRQVIGGPVPPIWRPD
jgi:hypothetical protein